MAGILYLVATPIGNLEDMTFRAVRTLSEVDLIAAEDTRNSIKLLYHFEIKTPMTSYHEFNKYDKAKVLVSSFNSARTSAFSFLSCGRNASNANRLVGSPDEISAVIQAHAPGTAVTVTPAASACRTSSSPGSEIPGVPASVITAIFVPVRSLSTG